ncbi:MAG: preprotein translocase subunit SecY [Bacilli bacterium]
MFVTLKQIFNVKNIALRNKIIFTLAMIALYLVGKTIQVPGTTPITTDGGGIFGLLNLMSGNALANVSIFALGVQPYITASIVIQLLSMDVLPVLTRLSQEGEVGKKKLSQITRYCAIVLAVVQGFSYALLFDKSYGVVEDTSALSYMLIILTLTAGTAFVLWIGDQITNRGVGNGVSVIIMVGIVSGFPIMMKDAFNTLYVGGTTQESLLGIGKFALFILLYVLIIIVVVYVQEGVRRVAIQYSNRSSSAYNGGGRNFIPLKINSAGVIPVIFATAILGAPLVITSIASYWVKDVSPAVEWIEKYLDYTTLYGFILYIILIVAFAYFYTFIQVNPETLSENLQKSGAYVPGIRPGEETTKHFTKILYRLTFFGSIFLAVIAGLPILFANFTSMPDSVRLGGTSLLIVVGVSLEIIRQIEQQLVGYGYEGYVTK